MKRILLFSLLILAGLPLSAQTPAAPSSGELSYRLASPVILGGGMHLTRGGTPQGVFLNPAVAAPFQRVILDLNYTNLQGLGGPARGMGHAANLAVSLPGRSGVWTTTLGLIDTQAYQGTAMEWGIHGRLGLTFSKEVYSNLWMGFGIDAALGDLGQGLEGGGSLNLGFLHFIDSALGLKNFVWGITLSGLGYRYGSRSRGYLAGVPENITPAAGAAFDLVSKEKFRWILRGDLRFPSVTDLWFGLGMDLHFGEVMRLSLSSSVDLQDLSKGHWQTVIPSAGAALSFSLGGGKNSRDSSREIQKSRMDVQAAAAPLYDGVWAFGAGVTLPFGVRDSEPPVIQVDYDSPSYISPNYDGIQDEINAEYTVTDHRYVVKYHWTITDSSGTVVRSFRNKDERPENESLTNLWTRLVSKKTGTPLPPAVRWDGVGDQGAVVSDGTYFLRLEFQDDNGNTAVYGPLTVVVDTLAPELELGKPEGLDLIFSPDGDGSKDVFSVRQEGSVEKLWEASFVDAAGQPLRQRQWEDSPLEGWDWEGQDDGGQVVPDGVYSYRVKSRDLAGNAVEGGIEGIIIDTIQPSLGINIDRRTISPGTTSPYGSLTFILDVPVKTGIIDWSLDVVDLRGSAVRTWSRREGLTIADKWAFDGRGQEAGVLPEGDYQGRLWVSYRNGHETSADSPPFTVDITPPQASVQASAEIFSPDGDGRLDTLTFTQESSPEELWTSRITDSEGQVVKTWTWVEQAQKEWEWDGRDDQGRLVPDGRYTYQLEAEDKAGNPGGSAPVLITVDTRAVEAGVTASRDYFNKEVSFYPSAQTESPVAGWVLDVLDSQGGSVQQWKGEGAPPESVTWKGGEAPDGSYQARLQVEYRKGTLAEALSGQVVLDTQPPRMEVLLSGGLFSPNSDNQKDTILIRQSSSEEPLFEAVIEDSAGSQQRSWRWSGRLENVEWDGRDDLGNLLPDGSYRYRVTGQDLAGNSSSETLFPLTIDTKATPVYLTALAGFIKAGETEASRFQQFTAVIPNKEGMARWKFTVESEEGRTVMTETGEGLSPEKFTWAGTDDQGRPVEGTFRGVLALTYAKGNQPRGETRVFISDGSPPEVEITLNPQPFSPDGDNIDDEVIIGIQVEDQSRIQDWSLMIRDPRGKEFISFGGTGRPSERIIWDGRSGEGELVQSAEDYPYTFIITDVLGHRRQTEGDIAVDVLVIRDGDQLKILISNITFAPYQADLVVSGEKGEKNLQILNRLAEILKKYGSYKIIIEGHAVSEYWDNPARAAVEERDELAPLSRNRAESVKTALSSRGTASSRMEARGKGGTEPLVSHGDLDNRWKNRRVEFLLVK